MFILQLFGSSSFFIEIPFFRPQPPAPPQQQLSPPPPGRETEIERRERIRRLRDPNSPIMDEHHPHFYRQTPGGGIAT